MTNATTKTTAEAEIGSLERGRPRRVVVGVGLDTRSAHALVWADRAARALSAELLIVHVIPTRFTVRPIVWEAETARGEPVVRATAERARPWCEAILARALPAGSLAFVRGPVAAAVLDAIDETAADLVVLGAGALARHVARRTLRPLLVARAPGHASRILAFTDFSDPCFPVLRHAAALRPEAGEVTFVGSRQRGRERAQREMLMGSVAAEYANVAVLVSEQRPTEQALLATANLWGADLVAVPSHPKALRMRAGLDDLGCRVAASATSSVLVVPIGAAAASA